MSLPCCIALLLQGQYRTAQASVRRGSRLVRQLGAIVTFGQPRTGDAEYARTFDARFGDRAFRYVCGCDMVRRTCARVGMQCLCIYPVAHQHRRLMLATRPSIAIGMHLTPCSLTGHV